MGNLELLKNKIMTTINRSMQLPIDECEEWIWDTLDSTKDCGFEYIKDGDREFLIFNTNDFFADAKGLEKIKKSTDMELVQMSTHNGYTVMVWQIYAPKRD